MAHAVVVCSHLPGEGHFESERFDVCPVLCDDDFAYWRALDAHWNGPATILNVEHDVEVTDAHLAALLDCPEPLCSWPYRIHWASCGLAGGTPSVRGVDGEWADWSAIGLVRITPEARAAPLRREPWQRVERSIAAAVRGPWHLHTPEVDHWHF